MKNIFRRKPKQYEIMCLMSHMDYVDEKLKKLQDEGWEVCGEVLLKNKDGWCQSTYFYIPMKRQLKENVNVSQ